MVSLVTVASLLNRQSFLPFFRRVGRGEGVDYGVNITTDQKNSQKNQDQISPDLKCSYFLISYINRPGVLLRPTDLVDSMKTKLKSAKQVSYRHRYNCPVWH